MSLVVFVEEFKGSSVSSDLNIVFMTLPLTEKMSVYDDIDADILRNYSEFQLASVLYTCMMEANCSEQSSRMTAMDNATKNAGQYINYSS